MGDSVGATGIPAAPLSDFTTPESEWTEQAGLSTSLLTVTGFAQGFGLL